MPAVLVSVLLFLLFLTNCGGPDPTPMLTILPPTDTAVVPPTEVPLSSPTMNCFRIKHDIV
jgi:hypothetical protein